MKCSENVVERLARLGFSKYEARAYLTLLRESPVTGYKLAKLSGIPLSAIYEVGSRLVVRGAAMILRMESTDKYAPVPAIELLEQLRRRYGRLVASLKEELAGLNSVPEPKPVWNIEGRENTIAKAKEMIDRANNHIYLAPSSAAFPALQPSLGTAIRRGARLVIVSMMEPAPRRIEGACLLLVVDGEEVLIGERLAGNRDWPCGPAALPLCFSLNVSYGPTRTSLEC
jgi:sugar-specific transcriptional regulator TrmB